VIAAALGIREASDDDVVDRIKALLRERNLLVILDNFEHVLQAAALVTDLLATCPQVTVLATSREALHVAAEHRFTVGPLPLPSAQDEMDLQQLEGVPAVALFSMRAQQVRASR